MKATSQRYADDYFLSLLDIVLPGRHGTLMVLSAYFDASERTSGDFCVAGFAFVKPQVKKFNKEWSEIFAPYGGCHMKDLTKAVGGFKGLSNTETGALLKRGIAVIKKRMSFGVVVSCKLPEINDLLPAHINGFQHAYPVCCHLAMAALGMKMDAEGMVGDVAYFFEAGDDYAGAAHDFMKLAEQVPELRANFHYGSDTFLPAEKAIPFEAADVLAWEWTKYMDETKTGKTRKMRLSLAALMGHNNDFDSRYYGVHLGDVVFPVPKSLKIPPSQVGGASGRGLS